MAVVVQMPRLSDTMEEGVLLKWRLGEGAKVEVGDILAEVETDKANMELEAFDGGTLLKVLVQEGQRVPVGTPLAIIGEPGEDIEALLAGLGVPTVRRRVEPTAVEAEPAKPPGLEAQRVVGERVKASPLARRLAREAGVDLAQLKGSGPEGRIRKRDVEAAISAPRAPEEAVRPAPETQARPAERYEEIEPSLMRLAVARRMSMSKAPVPHFYLTVEVDMDKVVELRESIKDMAGDVKITYNDIILKAVALALRQHPWMNASYVEGKIRLHKQIDIGVAVALEEGLITPVIRNCDGKSLGQIAREMQDLTDRAQNRKLKPEEYTGATFTVSNLGMYGIEEFSAIINPPEAGILAVGAIAKKPVVRDDQLAIGYRARLTLSCDHRVVDGATAARFLNEVRRLLENPLSLMV
ncbi:MAG: 2-oxo acid dehydrogenase subunit E2 [candidate division KSB1 bacterium]|nr:2-oxo acid dehydrogenase subunit E2 [candidate division KSB1 bacterium]